jgi:hypothetical protein
VIGFGAELVMITDCTGTPIDDCTVGPVVSALTQTSATEVTLMDPSDPSRGLILSPGKYAFHVFGENVIRPVVIAGQAYAAPVAQLSSPKTTGLLVIRIVEFGIRSRPSVVLSIKSVTNVTFRLLTITHIRL